MSAKSSVIEDASGNLPIVIEPKSLSPSSSSPFVAHQCLLAQQDQAIGTADLAVDHVVESPELPFFPSCQYELLGSVVSVWWFELDFCQSTYGPHSSCHSNACTLIAVLNAAAIARNRLQLGIKQQQQQQEPPALPHMVVRLFGESIVLGNRVYCNMARTNRLAHCNLNIPEAMAATVEMIGDLEEWKSFVYLDDLGRELFNSLSERLSTWQTMNKTSSAPRSHVFVVLITENRSILMVFQQIPVANITVYDSHQHSANAGSCIAHTTIEHLPSMCQWIRTMFQDIYNVRPKCFELSFIHSKAQNVVGTQAPILCAAESAVDGTFGVNRK